MVNVPEAHRQVSPCPQGVDFRSAVLRGGSVPMHYSRAI